MTDAKQWFNIYSRKKKKENKSNNNVFGRAFKNWSDVWFVSWFGRLFFRMCCFQYVRENKIQTICLYYCTRNRILFVLLLMLSSTTDVVAIKQRLLNEQIHWNYVFLASERKFAANSLTLNWIFARKWEI